MRKLAVSLLISALALPGLALAQATSLAPVSSTPANLACMDFGMNLRFGANVNDLNTKLEVLKLQQALGKEGFNIQSSELGMYGDSTRQAVKAFQEKYKSDVLAPFGLSNGSGYAGAVTRMKLQALYGCRASSMSTPVATTSITGVNLSVPSLGLDSSGVTATFCNNGKSDLPTTPFRIRLNGINRDFEIIGTHKAGACDTETFGYATWGLTYNQGNTYGAVSLIDPNGVYKTANNFVPLTQNATLAVPALPGVHLSVRGVSPKTNGIQSTLCNLGTVDLTSFPVRVTVNGSSKVLDVPDAYKAGKCTTANWTYDMFGLIYTPNTVYTVTVTTDPNNAYAETNELDNTATVVGTP